MYVLMYVCICVYVCMHVCVCMYVMCVYMIVCVRMYVCMHVCVRTCLNMYVYNSVCTYVYIAFFQSVCVCVCGGGGVTWVGVDVHTYIYVFRYVLEEARNTHINHLSSIVQFQPVLHDWCNKGSGICYPICGMMHIKEPLLLIGKSSP